MKQPLPFALTILLLASALSPASAQVAPLGRPLLDPQGRQIVPGGFVTITEDKKGGVPYTPDDYRRMVRMGANFQVIRTTLGRLGGWPGRPGDPKYLAQLDSMVRMAREAGLQTIFKLVIYDLRPFGSADWDAIYHNTDGTRDTLTAAWEKLWTRYKDDPSVFGYDLLNEPQRGLSPDEAYCSREELLPTLRLLADAMHAISPEKWALYQPLYRETGTGEGPFQPMVEPFGRDRIIYAPHLYSMDLDKMRKMLANYMREAALSNAPLLLGEWGPATDITADTDPAKQATYTKVYQTTANTLDRNQVGAIKAWYTGSRSPLKNKSRPAPFTWAIFSDASPAGSVERKFITDTLARPRPLVVAGRLERYGYRFAAHTMEILLKPNARLGSTRIFVPAERHYPQGFHLEIGPGLILAHEPGSTALRILHTENASDRQQAKEILWDDGRQLLVIRKWIHAPQQLVIKIRP